MARHTWLQEPWALIELRMTGDLTCLARQVRAPMLEAADHEVEATHQADVLARALGQGLSPEAAEAQLTERWR